MSRPEKRKSAGITKRDKKRLVILLLSVIITAAGMTFAYHHIARQTHPVRYADIIEKYSSQYGVPKDLLYATIMVESSFNENATSEAGAIGLTQIMPDTLKWLLTKTGESYTEEDLKNPEIAIKYCALFYSILLERFESEDAAICAYHSGISRVDGWLKNSEYSADGIHLDKIPSSVTAHYLKKINNARKTYISLYKEEL